jgi:hypothetical protein
MPSTYLTRTTGTPTSDKIMTFSFWLKKGVEQEPIMSRHVDSSNRFQFYNLDSTTKIQLYQQVSGSVEMNLSHQRALRDFNGWYHWVIAIDTTQATDSDRVKIYINGELLSGYSTATYPAQNADILFNGSSVTQEIGRTNGNDYFNGSMSHFHFIDGTQYAASDFGSTDSTTGEWKINPAPNVNYGNNGFFVLKDGNSVTDQSPNTNNFTVASGTLTKTEDNPSNVFATWNPLQWTYDSGGNPPNTSFGNGNTSVLTSASSGDSADVWGTLGADSGKYYYEVKMTNNPSDSGNTSMSVGWGNVETGERITYYGSNGYQYYASGSATYGATYTQNDIIGVAVDLTNGTIEFYKNGTSQGSITNRITTNTGYWQPLTWDGSGSLTASWNANFGGGFFGTTAVSSNSGNGYSATGNLGIFQYQPSTGYTALCTKGLNL